MCLILDRYCCTDMGLQVREIKAKEGNRVDYKVQGLIFLKNMSSLHNNQSLTSAR